MYPHLGPKPLSQPSTEPGGLLMLSVISRRLPVAGLLATALFYVNPAQAQNAVTVGGVVYARYLYLANDTANHNNNFDVTRSYLNVIGRFDGGIMTRVTGDVYRS